MAYHMFGDHRKELEVVHRGQRQLPRPTILWQEVFAVAALGRIDQLNAVMSKHSMNDGFTMALTASELRLHGHVDAATQMQHRAIEWYENRPPDEKKNFLVHWQPYVPVRLLAQVGRLDEARAMVEALIDEGGDSWQFRFPASIDERADSLQFLYPLGMVAARQGNRPEALRISESLLELGRSPRLQMRSRFRFTLQGAFIAAQLGQLDRATELVRKAMADGLPAYWLYTPYQGALDLPSALQSYPPFQELMRPKG